MPQPDLPRDLKTTLKALKLGKLLPVLPERLRIARERRLDPADVLLLVLGDEVQRRNSQRAVEQRQPAEYQQGKRGSPEPGRDKAQWKE